MEVVPAGERPRIHQLDPKYKLEKETVDDDGSDGRPRKGDIDKMHAYRDAIRNAAGERVVRAADNFSLDPAVRNADRIEALPAYPDAEQAPQDRLRHIFGDALAP